jgi:hypothetical protein
MTTLSFKSLSDDEFEDLCVDLLKALGFVNVRKMSGRGGGDFGRDIHAEEVVSLRTDYTRMEKILAQAKKFTSKSISNTDMSNILNNARSLDYTRVIVFASSDFSSPARRVASDALTVKNPVETTLWNGKDIEMLLKRYPQLKKKHFKLPRQKIHMIATTLPVSTVPVDLQIAHNKWTRVDAIIDTGARLSLIPHSLFRQLSIRGASMTQILENPFGTRMRVDMAIVNARIGSRIIPLRLAVTERDDYPMILGRQALNHFKISTENGKIRLE